MDHPNREDAEIAFAVSSISFFGLHSSLFLSMLLTMEILNYLQPLLIQQVFV
jgi:hypothetical protein